MLEDRKVCKKDKGCLQRQIYRLRQKHLMTFSHTPIIYDPTQKKYCSVFSFRKKTKRFLR